MQGHASRRSHEQACPREEFWDVISTLTQDLTKARNQLARLMRLAKPGGVGLFGGDCGRPALQPIRDYMPYAGSQVPNCHRCPPPGHAGCGKKYPHYQDPSPAERTFPRRPVTVCRANSIRHSQRRAPSFSCGRSPQRAKWSFEQPQDRAQCSFAGYSRAPETPYSCERQEKCGTRRTTPCDCVQTCFNPDLLPAPCRRSDRTPNPCRGGSSPVRLRGGGRGRDCIATQFVSLLQDVTCQLRERRLAAAADRGQVSRRRIIRPSQNSTHAKVS